MGTSNSNKGNRGATPLIPSFLNIGNGEYPPETPDNNGVPIVSPVPEESLPPNNIPMELPPIPPAADSDRYRAPRTNFSKFASSGGNDLSSLKKAVSGYVKHTSGGVKNAMRNMGSSRKAGANLLGVLTNVVSRGVQEVLHSLNLSSLTQSPIEDIFVALADYICPNGGTLDEGIAREAFTHTIVELATNGITDLNILNLDQVQTVLELYISHSIETKLYNEIGNKAIIISPSVLEAEKVESQLHDFIKNSVADSLTANRDNLENLTSNRIQGFVDNIYEQAFTILSSFSNS